MSLVIIKGCMMDLEKIDNELTVKELVEDMLRYPQAELPTKHTFIGDQYIREMSAIKGTLIVGHYHKFHQINMCTKGKIAVLNKDGGYTIYQAGDFFIGAPGRKIALVIEDMTWINVIATKEKDISKIEDEILDKSVLAEIDPELLKCCKVDQNSGEIILIDQRGVE